MDRSRRKDISLTRKNDASPAVEEEAASTREAFKIYFENSFDVIYMYDRDLKVLSVSPSVQRLLGYSPSEIVGKTFPELDILAPESVAAEVTDAMRVFSGEAKENSEYVFVARDGSRMYGEVCGIPVMKDGKAVSVVGVARDITDRKLAEAAQRSSEASYRVLFQQSPIAVVSFDNNLVITDVNDRLLAIMNTERDAALGFNVNEVEDKKVIPYFQAAINGEVTHYEGKYRATTGGAEIWASASSSPIWDADGKVTGGIAVIEDITAQKRFEGALRESEELHRALFQQSPLGIFVFDTELIITECNERLIEILRSSREKLVGFDLHGLKDRRPFHALMEAMTGRVATYEGSYEPTTGMGTVQASFIFSPLLDEAGVVIGGVATLEDIRDRLLSQEKLRRSEEIHRALFQQSLLGIFTFDKDMKVTDCTDRILEKIGVSREVAIGFDLHGMTDRNLLPAMFKALGGETGTYEGRYKSALGKRVELEVSVLASPLRDTAGGVSGAIVALEDITLQKKAQEELRSYSERLEELVTERTRQLEKSVDDLRALNDELEAFGYSVSHDLRVPLRAISGLTKMLLDEHAGQLGGDGRRLMDLILKNTEHMGDLVEDLLGLSRAQRREMKWGMLDMRQLASDVIGDLEDEVSGRDVRFVLDMLPPASGDRVLVRQVLMNLIGNSVKFTGKKDSALIEIAGNTNGAENTYFVRDNGAGFDMDYAEKLFGVFQRLHRAEDFEGTGVGLALTERIVRRHGGKVWAESEIGQGATFYFTLPAPRRD